MSVQNKSPRILLLIPAYNEEARIGPVLVEYAKYFKERYAGEFSIVVVLNGCEDNTLGVVQAAQKEHPEIRYLNYEEPIGKGGALIEGLHHFYEADYIGYVDADGATQPPAFHDLIKHRNEADCIISMHAGCRILSYTSRRGAADGLLAAVFMLWCRVYSG